MNIFNKTTIAVALSLLGAASSMSAIAMATGNSVDEQRVSEQRVEVHEIKINAEDGHRANVFVNINGDITEFSSDEIDFNDKEKLAEMFANVPQDERDKLIESLANIHLSENRVVVDIDGHPSMRTDLSAQVVQEFIHKSGAHVMKFRHGGKMTADNVIKMLSNGQFSADELNKIQSALDAKR